MICLWKWLAFIKHQNQKPCNKFMYRTDSQIFALIWEQYPHNVRHVGFNLVWKLPCELNLSWKDVILWRSPNLLMLPEIMTHNFLFFFSYLCFRSKPAWLRLQSPRKAINQLYVFHNTSRRQQWKLPQGLISSDTPFILSEKEKKYLYKK